MGAMTPTHESCSQFFGMIVECEEKRYVITIIFVLIIFKWYVLPVSAQILRLEEKVADMGTLGVFP
jgi:hypothetical protein